MRDASIAALGGVFLAVLFIVSGLSKLGGRHRNHGVHRRRGCAVQTLLDYLAAGESIDDFLEGFPSISRDQVITFLEQAKEQLVAAS